MPVALKGSTSGQVTLDVPAVAGTNTLTLPAKTGNIITSADSGTVTQTMMASGVAGNGPAFSAYQSSAQTCNNATATKVQFQTKEYDTASCYDNTTNYRFTPNVAGYYLISVYIQSSTNASASSTVYTYIYKNGSSVKQTQLPATSGNQAPGNAIAVIYLNGTTDYVEGYYAPYVTNNLTLQATSDRTYFQGTLIRSA